VVSIMASSKKTSRAFVTHLLDHFLQLGHFPVPSKEAKIITLPKPNKDPKLSSNLCHIRLLSAMGKLFEKLILRKIQKHVEERNSLNAS
jgi:hypothetical protein